MSLNTAVKTEIYGDSWHMLMRNLPKAEKAIYDDGQFIKTVC